jgi:hypothetical protein
MMATLDGSPLSVSSATNAPSTKRPSFEIDVDVIRARKMCLELAIEAVRDCWLRGGGAHEDAMAAGGSNAAATRSAIARSLMPETLSRCQPETVCLALAVHLRTLVDGPTAIKSVPPLRAGVSSPW